MVTLMYYSMMVFIVWVVLAYNMNQRMKQQACGMQGYGTGFTFGELLVSLIWALLWPIVMVGYVVLLLKKRGQ